MIGEAESVVPKPRDDARSAHVADANPDPQDAGPSRPGKAPFSPPERNQAAGTGGRSAPRREGVALVPFGSSTPDPLAARVDAFAQNARSTVTAQFPFGEGQSSSKPAIDRTEPPCATNQISSGTAGDGTTGVAPGATSGANQTTLLAAPVSAAASVAVGGAWAPRKVSPPATDPRNPPADVPPAAKTFAASQLADRPTPQSRPSNAPASHAAVPEPAEGPGAVAATSGLSARAADASPYPAVVQGTAAASLPDDRRSSGAPGKLILGPASEGAQRQPTQAIDLAGTKPANPAGPAAGTRELVQSEPIHGVTARPVLHAIPSDAQSANPSVMTMRLSLAVAAPPLGSQTAAASTAGPSPPDVLQCPSETAAHAVSSRTGQSVDVDASPPSNKTDGPTAGPPRTAGDTTSLTALERQPTPTEGLRFAVAAQGAVPTSADFGSVTAPQPAGPASLQSSGQQDPSPPAPLPVTQAASAIAALVSSKGPQSMTLELDPGELGRLDIRIDRSPGGAVAVRVFAERPQTLALLIDDRAELQRTLDQAGIHATGRTISFHAASDALASGIVRDAPSTAVSPSSPIAAGGEQSAAGFTGSEPRRESATAAAPDPTAASGANSQGSGASGFGGGERPDGDGRNTRSRSIGADTDEAAAWRPRSATSAIDITA